MTVINVKIDGLDALIKDTDPAVLREPLSRFFTRAGMVNMSETQKRSPVDTGRLRSSLARGGADSVWSLHSKSRLPDRLIVGTKVTHKGESYPAKLETEAGYHYRGGRAHGRAHPKAVGPFATMRTGLLGKPTKGWFSGGIRLASKRFPEFMRRMAREIEEHWGRG